MKLSDLGELFGRERTSCPGQLVYTRHSHYTKECNGRLVLRSNGSTGELFWGCSTYPECRNTTPFSEFDLHPTLPFVHPKPWPRKRPRGIKGG